MKHNQYTIPNIFPNNVFHGGNILVVVLEYYTHVKINQSLLSHTQYQQVNYTNFSHYKSSLTIQTN